MTTPKRPRDPNQLAKFIVDVATREDEPSESGLTKRVTPAMAADVTDRLWEIGDIVALVEEVDAKPGKRGPYRKSALDQVSS